jgi:phosphoribosylaminoimidazole (AIR) synthetase
MIAPFPDESPEDFLGRVAQALSEHFEVVQIFAQVETSDHTDVFNVGYGNVLARQKQMENWLEMMAGSDEDEEGDDDE